MVKNDPKPTAKILDVEVKCAVFQTRSGIKAKKGDVIAIPSDEKHQSPAIRQALKSGNLRAVKAQTDLGPVTSEPADGTGVGRLDS